MNMINNQRGVIPVVMIFVLAITALIGAAAIGFLLSGAVQMIVMVVAFVAIIYIVLIKSESVTKIIRELKGNK